MAKRRGMLRARAKKVGRRVSYELIDRTKDTGRAMYRKLETILEKERHHELVDTEARIALAWCTSWKADVDGRIILGKCVKASDLHRELAPYDFVILLSRWFWEDVNVSDEQRMALLDHELTHAACVHDHMTGEIKRDERGRACYRIRKHDIEEFSCIVAEYGTYKRDLEMFADALHQGAMRGFVACDQCKDTPHPGRVEVVEGATTRLARCECWLTWQKRLAAA